VAYLNEASIDYNVKLSVPIDLFNATDDYMPPNGYRAELVHEHVLPEAIEKKDANWWWKYTLIFHCYYGTGATGITANPTSTLAEGTKITDPVELRRIQQELNMLLRQGMEIVATFELLQSSHGIVGFAVEDPRLSNTPFIDGPPTMPPTLAPTFTSINVSFPSMSPTTSAERGQYRPNTPTNRLEDDELIDDDVAGEGGVSSTGIKDTKNRQYPTFSDPLRVQQWVRALRVCRNCKCVSFFPAWIWDSLSRTRLARSHCNCRV
jgi:hypothetical protein